MSDAVYKDLIKLIGRSIPSDKSEQYHPFKMLSDARDLFEISDPNLLDFGTGVGGSIPNTLSTIPKVRYTGIDIGDGTTAQKNDYHILSYDGNRLPFDDETFDVVFSK